MLLLFLLALRLVIPATSDCYSAYVPSTGCAGYAGCGYTCVGNYCGSTTCLCSCTLCATHYPGYVFDPTTATCISPNPTSSPSSQPTTQPTRQPTSQPSMRPSCQPSTHPSSQPTSQPFSYPTSLPSVQPSSEPSCKPTSRPSKRPSSQPSSQPSYQPSCHPTSQPSSQPSCQPSSEPSCQPSCQPSSQPSCQPSSEPSCQPSCQPSSQPSCQPSSEPSCQPTSQPSSQPTCQPSCQPSSEPSCQPSSQPSCPPSSQPSCQPTYQPSSQPSCQPSSRPSCHPSSCPTFQPSCQPSTQPTCHPSCLPSSQPTFQPSCRPSFRPSSQPSSSPSRQPSCQPSCKPSIEPSSRPSSHPSYKPSTQPSAQPSCEPSCQPISRPSSEPSSQPTRLPSFQPLSHPSSRPSSQPSSFPSMFPSCQPSSLPTENPSCQPFSDPSTQPSSTPSQRPSCKPSIIPSSCPSSQPSFHPLLHPTSFPSSNPSSCPTSPSSFPTFQPSSFPSTVPSKGPSSWPSSSPTHFPSCFPSMMPSTIPSACPSLLPTIHPTCQPTSCPSNQPTISPSSMPSGSPSSSPTKGSERWNVRVDNFNENISMGLSVSDAIRFCREDRWVSQSYSGNCTLRRAILFCLFQIDWVNDDILSCRVYFQVPQAISIYSLNSSSWMSIFLFDQPIDFSVQSEESDQYFVSGNFSIEIDGMGSSIFLSSSRSNFNFFNIQALSLNDSISNGCFRLSNLVFQPIATNTVSMLVLNASYFRTLVFLNVKCNGFDEKNYPTKESRFKCGNFDHIFKIELLNSSVVNNVGWNGGSFSISNIAIVTISHCIFSNNSAMNIGGVISISNVSSYFSVKESRFEGNSASRFGGSIYCSDISGWMDVLNSYYIEGKAKYGSAISLAYCGNTSILGSYFRGNQATEAGTIYWIYGTMSAPFVPLKAQQQIFGNIFMGNIASGYGNDYASSLQGIRLSQYVILINNYISGKHPLNVNATIVDAYGQIIVGLNGVLLTAWVNQQKANCEINDVLIYGNTLQHIYQGKSKFDLGISCYPGGYANVTFSSWFQDMNMIYSRSLASTNSRLNFVREVSVDAFVKFRRCVRGEIFDLYSILRSTCSICIGGYSLNDNFGEYATSCEPCPKLALSCDGSSIVLPAGYWRSSVSSSIILKCLLHGSCLGGNGTGSSVCAKGYHGPLCGTCDNGFYFSMMKTCLPCTDILIPGTYEFWFYVTVASIMIAIGMLFFLYERISPIVELYLSRVIPGNRLKVVISTIQIASSSFPYLTSQRISSVFGALAILQLDFSLIFPFGCIFQYDAIDRLLVIVLVPIFVVFLLSAVLFLAKIIIAISIAFNQFSGSCKVWNTMRKNVPRLIKFTVLMSYYLLPSISSQLFQMFACEDVLMYQTINGFDVPFHTSLLRSDVSIDCNSHYYRRGWWLAFGMVVVYPIGVPLIYLALLYKFRHSIINRNIIKLAVESKGITVSKYSNITKSSKSKFYDMRRFSMIKIFDMLLLIHINDLITSLDFLYDSYQPLYWYWEVIEVWKRLFMMSIVSSIFQSAEMCTAVNIIFSIFMMKLYYQHHPLQDEGDNGFNEFSGYILVWMNLIVWISLQNTLSLWDKSDFALFLLTIFFNASLVLGNIYYSWEIESMSSKCNKCSVETIVHEKEENESFDMRNSYHVFYFRKLLINSSNWDIQIIHVIVLSKLFSSKLLLSTSADNLKPCFIDDLVGLPIEFFNRFHLLFWRDCIYNLPLNEENHDHDYYLAIVNYSDHQSVNSNLSGRSLFDRSYIISACSESNRSIDSDYGYYE